MRILNIKLFVAFVTIIGFQGCRQGAGHLDTIRVSQVGIDSSLQADDSLTAFIEPYRKHVQSVLDSPLAFAPRTLTKSDGELNSSLGNLIADIVLAQADSLERRREEDSVDFAVLNHGGIRSVISAGAVSERTAYQVMPFENTIYIAEMDGSGVMALVRFLAEAEQAHPIAGIRIELDTNQRLQSVHIGERPFDPASTYRVATSSYLIDGGDDMTFFQQALDSRDTGYRVRNAMVDYFKRVDTLDAHVDGRFTRKSGS